MCIRTPEMAERDVFGLYDVCMYRGENGTSLITCSDPGNGTGSNGGCGKAIVSTLNSGEGNTYELRRRMPGECI